MSSRSMQRIAPASAIASEPVSDSLEFDELLISIWMELVAPDRLARPQSTNNACIASTNSSREAGHHQSHCRVDHDTSSPLTS
jgi:hypothetical protein